MPQTTPALTVGNVTIRQHNGLFSLNDLHQASGGNPKHQPAMFARRKATRALVDELMGALRIRRPPLPSSSTTAKTTGLTPAANWS